MTKMDKATHFVSRRSLLKAGGALVVSIGTPVAFTPHDLRRTAATRLHSLGIAPHVVEKILNHQMGGVMAVYNRAEYQPERIEGQETWAKSLLSLVGTPARKDGTPTTSVSRATRKKK